MAKTLNARFFSKPSSLREVKPELFLKFLQLGKTFLQTKDYNLPDKPEELDYERISSILTDPEGMDEDFQNALFQVGELAKQDEVLFDHMQELTKEKPWAPAIDAKATNADFAIAIYLNEPALLNEVHATDLFSSTKSFQYFMAEVDLEDYEFKMPSEGMLADLEKALDLGFTEKRRGGSSEVAIKQLGSCVVITVRHGEQFSRQAAIHEGKSTSVFYRPETHDLLIYETASGALRMTPKQKWLQELYLEQIGKYIFGSPDFFGRSSRFDFSPLRELGKDSLACAEFAEIEHVVLREVQILRSSGGQQLWDIRKAMDLFSVLESADETIPDGEIRKVSFAIKLKNSHRPKLLKIGSDNKEEVRNDQDRALFDRWLAARGFIREEIADEE